MVASFGRLRLLQSGLTSLRCTTAKRFYSSESPLNILKLHDRGLFHSVFPEVRAPELLRLLSRPQCVYCGFDPTADSLHVGNLLALIALLHCHRAGHQAIAVVGGATAQIGDPSGKTKDRPVMPRSEVDRNIKKISDSIGRIFSNHDRFIWKADPGKSPLILNNLTWYTGQNVVDFLASTGRHFRMGDMLAKQSVQSRIQSPEGMCFTEFTYQVFQAYDWLHLFESHDCRIQIGGNDQLGNIVAGYELVTRVKDKPVFGLTVPLITTSSGDKLGKTAGNAVWLDPSRTSPFQLYQFFLNLPDTEVEQYLKLFTFLSESELRDVMAKQKSSPEKRHAQKKIAEQVTLLCHGEMGLAAAERWTAALFGGSVEALACLEPEELEQLFLNAPVTQMLLEPDLTVYDVCMKAKCFSRAEDAVRIITGGGVYINNQRVSDVNHVLLMGQHVMPNGITLIRIGKKNYHIIKWENIIAEARS